MRDPEMVFVKHKATGEYFPIIYQQDSLGIYRESVRYDYEKDTWLIDHREQTDQAVFAGQWMANIKCSKDYKKSLFLFPSQEEASNNSPNFL
jgi:hypothetical protein